MSTYYGIKQQMSQTWDDQGKRIVVTAISVEPVVVTQVKTVETDGYNAIQIGISSRRATLNKPMSGHLKKAQVTPKYVREIRLDSTPEYKVGDSLPLSTFITTGDIISVTGTTKGKGFAGGMKRWNFSGGPKTHGQSDRARAIGSIGQGTTPGRVFKGKKMPGHMGNETAVVKNLQVVSIDDTANTVLVSGPVPGARNTLLTLTKLHEGDAITLYNSNEQTENEQDTQS